MTLTSSDAKVVPQLRVVQGSAAGAVFAETNNGVKPEVQQYTITSVHETGPKIWQAKIEEQAITVA